MNGRKFAFEKSYDAHKSSGFSWNYPTNCTKSRTVGTSGFQDYRVFRRSDEMAIAECTACQEFGNWITCHKCGTSFNVVYDEDDRTTIEETFYSEEE